MSGYLGNNTTQEYKLIAGTTMAISGGRVLILGDIKCTRDVKLMNQKRSGSAATSLTSLPSDLEKDLQTIPKGTNCAPLVADLFLFCYERDFMNSLSDSNQADKIEAFNSTFLIFR